MADRLTGYRILILETREEAQFSRLLSEQGADVVQCPMFEIHDAPDAASVEGWIKRFIDKPWFPESLRKELHEVEREVLERRTAKP